MSQRAGIKESCDLATQLYAEFRDPLIGFFMRRVNDRAEAEDLTQEVFARLIRAGELDRIENPKAFVFKVAANLLRDRNRSASRAGITRMYSVEEATSGPTLVTALVEDIGPYSVISARKSLSEVFRVLGELDTRTRDIFVLFRLENMKQREIAELLGVAQSTVEKHVVKAGLYLLERLGAEEER